MRDVDRREPPTREGATAAGHRYARTHAQHGESLILRHSGSSQHRWRLVEQHDRIGFAVAAFKILREQTTRGALAIWTNGRVDRFEAIDVGSQTGKTGPVDR